MADTLTPDDIESQDGAETLDETHLTRDGEDIANFDEIADVLDITSLPEDFAETDDDDALRPVDADFLPDESTDDSPRTRLEDRAER
jgi:hypothetical protein